MIKDTSVGVNMFPIFCVKKEEVNVNRGQNISAYEPSKEGAGEGVLLRV